MPNPLIGDMPDTAPLQVGFGDIHGLGRWSRFTMAQCTPSMDTTAQLVAGTNQAGSLAFAHRGGSVLCQVDTIDGLTLSGTAGALTLKFRIPEGWGYVPRLPLGAGTLTFRHLAPCLVVNNGVQTVGLLEIGRYGPSILAVLRDAIGTTWVNGAAAVYGQIEWENFEGGR